MPSIWSFVRIDQTWLGLSGGDATFADVVRLTFYVTGWRPEHIEDFMAASSVHALAFIDIVAFSFASGIGFAVLTISRLHRSLENELAARKRLFSILAHDLRSPFGGLVNLTDLIQIAFASAAGFPGGGVDVSGRIILVLNASGSNPRRLGATA